jgi:hypothetical protein
MRAGVCPHGDGHGGQEGAQWDGPAPEAGRDWAHTARGEQVAGWVGGWAAVCSHLSLLHRVTGTEGLLCTAGHGPQSSPGVHGVAGGVQQGY